MAIVRNKVTEDLNDKAFLNLLSDLVKDVEMFMINHELCQENRTYDQKKILSEIYKKKGLYSFFERAILENLKDLDSKPTIDLFDNLRRLELNHSVYFSDLYNKNSRPVKSLIEAEKRRQMLSDNLKSYYKCESINLRTLFNLDSIQKVERHSDEVSHLLFHYDKLTTTRDHESYLFLEDQLIKNSLMISIDLKQTFLLTMINYCIYHLKSGNNVMLDKMAKLYLYGLDEGILLNNNGLSETRFLNIIDVISNSELFMEANDFIAKWISIVITSDRTSVENIAHAMWSFASGDYDKTLQRLSHSEVHLTHLNLSQRARWIQLCSLCAHYPDYEEKEEVNNAALLFFRRHKDRMNEHTYKGSLNLVQIVKLIWLGASEIEIREFLNECDFIVLRVWINKMIREMAREEIFFPGH